MTRCVCGRTLHPSWREVLWFLTITAALVCMTRAERERILLHGVRVAADSLLVDWAERGCVPRRVP